VGERFFAHVQTGPGACPASCTGSFPGLERPGRGADHPSLLAPSPRKSRAMPLPPSGPSGLLGVPLPLRFLEKLYALFVSNDNVLDYPFEPHFCVSPPSRNNCSNTNYIETTRQSQINSYCFQNPILTSRSDRPGHIQVTQYVYKILMRILEIERSIKEIRSHFSPKKNARIQTCVCRTLL
jgi:hypothetical protein